MRKLPHFICLVAAALSRLVAAPAITNVQNAASNIGQGLPNAPVAQGSVFVVKGSGLGPASLTTATAAFQSTTLSGTSVAVTVNGTTVNALMYYTSDSQVAALLPSKTPVGTGSVTVTYANQISAPVPVIVVANNLGILTLDSSGGGPAIVTYGDYSLVSAVKSSNCGGPLTACGAANPGDTVSMWGTGLGPVNGDDASGVGLGQNLPNLPLTVWVGGVQAQVVYKGRSGCCVGEDQVVFTVPNNVPTGCAVPLAVQIGNQISNYTVIPVANGSRNCTPVVPTTAPFLSAALPSTYANVTLAHESDGGGTYEDDAKFQFLKFSVPTAFQPFTLSWIDSPGLGTCTVYNNLDQSKGNGPITPISLLDAGPTFTVTGPKGTVNIPVGSGKTAQFNASGAFLAPGNYTVTGTGGADVGPFGGTITIPSLPTLVSPVSGGTATRADGLTVTWTGGSQTGGTQAIEIDVNSCADNACKNGASVSCLVSPSATTFVVPPSVLLALPASTSAGVVLSSVNVAPFTATGIVGGFFNAYSNASGFGYGWGSGSFALK